MRNGRSFFGSVPNNFTIFNTGNIPNEKILDTAQVPKSKNLASNSSALRQYWLLRSNWMTTGNCSGGVWELTLYLSQWSKISICLVKKPHETKSRGGWLPFKIEGSWLMHMSSARSQDCHNECSWVGGRAGWETGVHLKDFIIRSASRKLRKRLPTRRSWRNSLWKSSLSSTFQAMVSVIAMNIQLSSPIMVYLSDVLPGTLSSRSMVRPGISWHRFFCVMYQWSAVLIGVDKHAVNKSIGRSGWAGSSSLRPHAAKWIESRIRGSWAFVNGVPESDFVLSSTGGVLTLFCRSFEIQKNKKTRWINIW